MKLESVALRGKDKLNMSPRLDENVLDTTDLVHEILTNRDKVTVADLACSAQSYLARGLAQLAVEVAEELKVKYVGFSGGVACNEHIAAAIRKTVENAGLKFLVHNKIPAGDGGTSFGPVSYTHLRAHET